MKKLPIVDIIILVSITLVLVLLNEFEMFQIVKTYSVPIIYGAYLLGRFSVKFNRS